MELSAAEAAFFANRPQALPLYEALRGEAMALKGTQVKVQKTQITFGAPRGYCVVAHPPSKRMGEGALICCLSLGHPLSHPLLQHNVQVSLHRYTCRLLLTNTDDVTAVLPYLKESFEGFGQK